MKSNAILFYLLLFIDKVINSSILTNQKNTFLNRLPYSLYKSKKVSNSVKELYKIKNDTIIYDPSRIKSILEKNNFPEKYNFFESTNVTKIIKDQGKCGCCWTIASTTALSYRFNKLGYNLDLSPQEPLSCYIKDCDKGANPINAIFNLIKNGTVTEKCFPYTSGDGKVVDECPTKCKDGSEYKKYYGKNGFSTFYDYSEENYYDIVQILINQLINYGPFLTSINAYKDFSYLYIMKNCANFIYSHKDNTKDNSGHALVIVGYGYEQSKYYWLAQNSWGEEFCDKGLLKIEFGQVGVERATFLEPYITGNNTDIEEININFEIDKTCQLNFKSNSDIKNSFEISAKNNDNEDIFYFQCGKVDLNNGNENLCTLNEDYSDFYNKTKGNYQSYNLQSLGNENKFNLEKPFNFYFYGIDLILPFFAPINMFVSEGGSTIMFHYRSDVDDKRFVSKIYPNVNSTNHLRDCYSVHLNENALNFDYIVYCKINSDELQYFPNYKDKNDTYLTYDVLCGSREKIEAIVYKLDKENYPVFRIKKFIVFNEYIRNNANFKLIADVEGSLNKYNTEINYFIVLIELENGDKKQTHFGKCDLDKPSKIGKNFEINCIFVIYNGEKVNYTNIYLSPYSYPNKNLDPFEIIIENKIKGSVEIKEENTSKEIEDEPSKFIRSNTEFIKISLSLILFILILF